MIDWDRTAEPWVARVGPCTFRYYPAERRMVFRGKSYHGVAEGDIDAFVHNRRSR